MEQHFASNGSGFTCGAGSLHPTINKAGAKLWIVRAPTLAQGDRFFVLPSWFGVRLVDYVRDLPGHSERCSSRLHDRQHLQEQVFLNAEELVVVRAENIGVDFDFL
jgi:hypothetical protein